MEQADIIVFLLSNDFIASPECMKEWNYAVNLASRDKPLYRIPIILRECAWIDMLGEDDVKALPADGKPVAQFSDEDTAWHQVYEGIKAVLYELRRTFTPKVEFLKEIEETDFPSLSHLKLQDIFVFLRLSIVDDLMSPQSEQDRIIANQTQLLSINYALIYGQEKVGKTALARHLFLSLLEDSQPVLLMHSDQMNKKPLDTLLQDVYQSQFYGDYSLWAAQSHKTLILDNMTDEPALLDLVVKAKDIFDRILITLSSDFYYSYFRDESQLAEFRQLRIEPLTRSQQEMLIKKRLQLCNLNQPLTDGFVDQVEKDVNSVLVSERLLPRYPFYVLTILQTYEAFMPSNLSVTSYSHCYYVLIVARIIRAGISNTDDAINACFNFADQLAFAIFNHRELHDGKPFNSAEFIENYKQQFFIPLSTINRLRNPTLGIINQNGTFRTEYMYYYFLGRFLARHKKLGEQIISKMSKETHKESSYFTLLFTIHHTNDETIIDDILLSIMFTLENIPPAVLDMDETKRFGNIVSELPESILSAESVKQVRTRQRNLQDQLDGDQVDVSNSNSRLSDDNPANLIYRVLKNNRVIGQILRSRHGVLERSKVEEIVGIIADSGLRLVNLILRDEEEIARLARYINSKYPEWDMSRIKYTLEYLSFVWTMVNIEQIVDAINVPEIIEAINNVVIQGATPAYDLIGYFSQLDSAQALSQRERDKLGLLLKKNKDTFVQRVLSIRTQDYMNTHRGSAMIEQSICSLLGIKYIHRGGGNFAG